RLERAAQWRNRAGVQRAVGVGGGLRTGEAADVHGGHDLSVAPGAVVEPGLSPAVGEAAGVEHLDRDAREATLDRIAGAAAPVVGPGVRLPRLPGGVGA